MTRPVSSADAPVWLGLEIKQLADDLVSEQQISLSSLLEDLSLTPEDFADPAIRLSLQQELTLYIRIANLNQDRQLALRHGRRQTLKDFGILGVAMMSAATLGDAIQVAVKYSRLISFSGRFSWQQTGDRGLLIMQPAPTDPVTSVFEVESTLAMLLTIFAELLNRPLVPLDVSFAYAADAQQQQACREAFGCTVEFQQPQNHLSFSTADLQQTIPFAHPEYSLYMNQLCADRIRALQAETTVSARTESYIRSRQGLTDLAETAAFLSLSPRTLRRRLQQDQLSFQQLLDKVRFERAGQLLLTTSATVQAVALALGYQDVANFRVAFRRWSGMTPGDFRRHSGITDS